MSSLTTDVQILTIKIDPKRGIYKILGEKEKTISSKKRNFLPGVKIYKKHGTVFFETEAGEALSSIRGPGIFQVQNYGDESEPQVIYDCDIVAMLFEPFKEQNERKLEIRSGNSNNTNVNIPGVSLYSDEIWITTKTVELDDDTKIGNLAAVFLINAISKNDRKMGTRSFTDLISKLSEIAFFIYQHYWSIAETDLSELLTLDTKKYNPDIPKSRLMSFFLTLPNSREQIHFPVCGPLYDADNFEMCDYTPVQKSMVFFLHHYGMEEFIKPNLTAAHQEEKRRSEETEFPVLKKNDRIGHYTNEEVKLVEDIIKHLLKLKIRRMIRSSETMIWLVLENDRSPVKLGRSMNDPRIAYTSFAEVFKDERLVTLLFAMLESPLATNEVRPYCAYTWNETAMNHGEQLFLYVANTTGVVRPELNCIGNMSNFIHIPYSQFPKAFRKNKMIVQSLQLQLQDEDAVVVNDYENGILVTKQEEPFTVLVTGHDQKGTPDRWELYDIVNGKRIDNPSTRFEFAEIASCDGEHKVVISTITSSDN